MMRSLIALAMLALLGGCASPLPKFQPPPAGPLTATVDVSRADTQGSIYAVCVGDKTYSVDAPADHRIVVPTTGRVAFGSFLSLADFRGNYQVRYTCNSAVSFVPLAGLTYLLNIEFNGAGCRLEVYREGGHNRIGLDIEPTAGPPQGCR